MKRKLTAVTAFVILFLLGSSLAKATPLSVTTTSTNCTCSGGNNGTGTATPVGGTAPYAYVWIPSSQTTATATGLSAGTYTVIVTDAASSTATAAVTITSPLFFVASVTNIYNPLCFGGTGCIQITAAGGTPPYSYLWSPSGGTADTACGLSAGSYTVTVIDNNGCTATATATLTQPSMLTSVTMSTTNNTSCASPNGTATANSAGGTFPYTYLWTPSGETTATATGLGAATYTCLVTDNNGCTSSTTAIVSGVTTPTLSITATKDTLPVGDIDTLIANCSASATYVWQPGGATTDTLTVSPVVTTVYTVTAVTSCGTYTATVTVVVVPTPCTNNYNEPICIVTIDTATNLCEVIWGRTNSPPATGSYNIYRDTTTLGWILIRNQALNILSEYLDVSSTPSAGPMSYKISTVDSCGESALSAVQTTIFLTTTASTNAYNLSWTPYVGFTPLRYRIYRGASMSTLTLLDSVPNTTYTYTDSFPPLGSFYMLEAENPGVCTPSTKIKPRSASSVHLSGSYSNGFNTAILGIPTQGIISANVNIYPNPASNILNVAIKGSAKQADFYLSDMLGRIVTPITHYQLTNGSVETIGMEGLQSGIYFLTIESDGQKLVKKVTKI